MSNPVLLAHNIIRLSDLTPSQGEELEHPIDHVYTDKRWEFWRPETAGTHDIEIRPGQGFQELLINSDFESSLGTEGWELDQGGGTATFIRNVTAPISGAADGNLDVTVFSANVRILTEKRYDLRANERYSLSWRAKTASGIVNLTAFILDEDGTTELASSTENIGTTLEGGVVTHTPTVDKEGVRFGLRVDAVSDIFVDDLSVTEDRQIDTHMIDAGHTLPGANVDVQFRDNLEAAFVSVSALTVNEESPASIAITNNNVQYVTFTAQRAKYWRVRYLALGPIPEVVGMYLGERFQFSEAPGGSIDPFGDDLIFNDQDGLHGDTTRIFRGKKNSFTVNLLMAGNERAPFEQFRDDIGAGEKAFWLNWNPELFPRRWGLYYTDQKNWRVRYEAGGEAIIWNMKITEIGQERKL